MDQQKAASVPAGIFRDYDIRGLVDQELNEDGYEALGRVFATTIVRTIGKGKNGRTTIVVGCDARESSPRYAAATIRGIVYTGCDVIDIGMVPTPVLNYATGLLPVEGGAVITASHNPAPYNGFKVRAADPQYHSRALNPTELKNFYKMIQEEDYIKGATPGQVTSQDVIDTYINYVKTKITLARPVKIVLDSGNGVAGPTVYRLFEELGAEVTGLFIEPDSRFPNHHPDPLKPENLRSLIAKVKEVGAEVGLAFDGDGDRLGVVDRNGRIVWPDMYLALLARDRFERKGPGVVVFDVKCSQALEEDIRNHGGTPLMAKTGYPNILAAMRETNALLGGELSGHIFMDDPEINFDDGTFAAANLVEYISREKGDFVDLVNDLPQYHSLPEGRVHCPDELKVEVMRELHDYYVSTPNKVIDTDGVRVQFADGWGLVRKSNTEPSLTTRFEAKTAEAAQRISDEMYTRARTAVRKRGGDPDGGLAH